jgi:hypothetical protein
MKRLAAILTALPLFGAVTFTASKALADTFASGTASNIASFNQSSDIYPYYHGWLFLGNRYYLWGGTYCSSYSYRPTATDIHILSDAVINRKTVGLYYKQGSSSYPCLTGYVIYNTTATASTSNTNESVPPPAVPK